MARLRLFANLREAAGTGTVDVPGSSVSAVLDAASEKFGDEFARGLAVAKVWVNGDQATLDTAVGESDEVALIPPVSGGASTYVRSPAGLEVGLLIFLVLAVGVMNYISLALFVTALVLASTTWALDLVEASWRHEKVATAGPAFAGIFIGALASYRFGGFGLSVATVIAGLIGLAWGIFFPSTRAIHVTATNVLLAVTGAAGTGALVVLRLAGEDVAMAALAVIATAAIAMWASGRTGLVDPFIAGVFVAGVAGVATGYIWYDTLLAPAAAGLAAGVGLVAGRGMGSLVRDGEVSVAGPFGGSLGELDGVLMAAAIYWVVRALLV